MRTVDSRQEFLTAVAGYLPKDITAIELGVMNGDFSNMILNILKPKTLYLVDPYEVNDDLYPDMEITTAYSTEVDYINLLRKFAAQIYSKQIIINRKYSYEAVKNYEDNKFDFIYIDACHTYDCVKKDLNDWLPKLKKDGLMCGHDYFEIFQGVIRAVDEFMVENDFEMILFNNSGNDWALKRK